MPNLAIFVDGDNVPAKETKNILTEARSFGRVVNASVFGDFSMPQMKPWKEAASREGLVTIQCDLLKGKNSTDIRLMIEVMKLVYTSEVVDIYVIVTSDSDYRHVVTEIKMRGKQCYCIGSVNTNNSLQMICDKFIKLENISKKVPTEGSAGSKEEGKKKMKQKRWGKFFNDIVRLSEEKGCVPLPKIKDEWEKKYQFDLREWGFPNFSSFLFHFFGSKLKRCGQGNEVTVVECEL